jgi:hypothetical protein
MISTCRRGGLLRTFLLSVLLLAASAPTARRRPAKKQSKKSKLQPNSLEHFAAFCRKFIVLDNAKPLELEPFQRLILKGYFGGVTEVLVLLPKKNGKTTLLAALALYHLIYTPNANCYIAASAKDQARILYEQATGFVERKDSHGQLLPQARALQKRVLLRKGTKEIRSRLDAGFVRVVSGDKDTVDGVIVTLALIDELHRHKDGGELYGVLADGVGPRDGQVFGISTAGETMKSLLGRTRAVALKLPGVKRVGAYTFARDAEGEFEMHEWSLSEEDDREDLEVVKRANPLSTNTIEKLGQRKKSPSMTPSRWGRFACGFWMQGEDAAYSSVDWKRNAVPALRKFKPGTRVYLGLDIGWRWDTTAIVPGEPWDREEIEVEGEEGWWRYRRVRIGKPTILTPPRNGESLKRKAIIDAILAFRDQAELEIIGVVFDRNADGQGVAEELESTHGIEVIEHTQDPGPMADSSMGFAEALGNDLVEHPDDDEFTAHVMAAKAKTTSGERWRVVAPEQRRGQRKRGTKDGDDVEVIDACVAAVMMHRNATAPHEPEKEPLVLWRAR